MSIKILLVGQNRQSPRPPIITLDYMSGVGRLNSSAASALNISAGDFIALAFDELSPSSWFIIVWNSAESESVAGRAARLKRRSPRDAPNSGLSFNARFQIRRLMSELKPELQSAVAVQVPIIANALIEPSADESGRTYAIAISGARRAERPRPINKIKSDVSIKKTSSEN